jgi:Asp-tRNA(Asn)/Glu-tRNA(Gln) amidotransferase B subunit
MVAEYGIEYDAGVLAADKAVADFFEDTRAGAAIPRLLPIG